MVAGSFKSKKVSSSRLNARSGLIKKAKRLNTHDLWTQLQEGLDESILQDTPILAADDPTCWALVAGPSKET